LDTPSSASKLFPSVRLLEKRLPIYCHHYTTRPTSKQG
jgi:hypothetical protein